MERTIWTDLAASLSIGAALVHAAAAGTHAGEPTLVALFTGTAIVQGAIGVVLLRAPSRGAIIAGAVSNAAFVLAWVMSRSVGLPLVDSLAGVEAVGVQDSLAAALAALSALVSLAGLRSGTRSLAPRLGWIPVVALVPAVFGVAAPHAHGDDPAHDHDDSTAAHVHEQSADAMALASDPLLIGADTTHASEAELTAAVRLVEATRAAVDATMSVEEAEAAGYVWIGDGRRNGGYQHYINHDYLTDDIDLDPTRIESLVFHDTGDDVELVSTMYVLQLGQTMDDVPDVAGDLTVWHDHQNLCWDESGTRWPAPPSTARAGRPASSNHPAHAPRVADRSGVRAVRRGRGSRCR